MKPLRIGVVGKFGALGMLDLLAATTLLCQSPQSNVQNNERTKIAEGEYLSREDNPYSKHQTELRQIWVLWRLADGKYLVESKLHFIRGEEKPDSIEQTLSLSDQLRPVEMKTISQSSSPVRETDIQMVVDEIRVTNPEGHQTKKVWRPEDFYDPISPWTWSGLARAAGSVKGPGRPQEFSIVDIDGPDAVIGIGEFWGRVQCLGPEQLETAGQKFNATKYVLHLGMFPGLFVWPSDDGLVLASQNEEDSGQRTELLKLRKYEELPKLIDPAARRIPTRKP
jgi:hypothetical protein